VFVLNLEEGAGEGERKRGERKKRGGRITGIFHNRERLIPHHTDMAKQGGGKKERTSLSDLNRGKRARREGGAEDTLLKIKERVQPRKRGKIKKSRGEWPERKVI